MKRQAAFVAILVLGLLAATGAPAEPPVERVVVVAVADADGDRVLVRWQTLEGVRRYDAYHVMRRHSDDTSWLRLNDDPITALTDAASIEAVFQAPGRADALGWIQETFGPSYATELLRLRSADAPDEARIQQVLLPDQNYGAALALGLGFLDETVVNGETYVYELWGADGQGYAVERLGRASATAGQPGALSAPLDLDCAEMGDQRSHAAAFLRWAGPDDEHWLFGYEVLRAPRNPDDTCPPVVPGAPGVVRANQGPVLPTRAGSVREGEELFALHCQSCHAAPDPRTTAPDTPGSTSGVKGGTLRGFRMRMNSDVTGLTSYPHDDAALTALSTEKLEKIFDWIQEFLFRDDGDDTPLDPVQVGETYCYQVYPRDLLGQLLTSSNPEQCEVQDLMPPDVPSGIKSERAEVDNYEICRISWDRNNDSQDGTVEYEVLKVPHDVPRNAYLDDGMHWANVEQPPGGARVVFDDDAMTILDATQRVFYAVRARDGAGNFSPATGWVPCVPRDIEPPPPPSITMTCCDLPETPESCMNTLEIPGWIEAGGDDTIVVEPRFCNPRLSFDQPGDTFGWRVYRSFNGDDFHQVAEVTDPYYDIDFQPTLDQKIWYRVEGYDKSGNRSETSGIADMLGLGSAKPPAPKILEAVHAIHGTESFIKITFRSLPPRALLGFAFYKQYYDPDDPFGTYYFLHPPLMVRYHDDNLSADKVAGQDRWAVKPGARTLDRLGVTDLPDETGPYLWFDELLNRWQMQVPMEEYETANLVITLRPIGWTGWEGDGSNFHWNGWSAGDLELDWPEHPDDNYLAPDPGVNDALTVVLRSTFNAVAWDAYPDGCNEGVSRPFAVFRRRGSSPHWKQISPLFTCQANMGSNPHINYKDYDVEDGFEYTYIVVRLDKWGEFAHRFGPTTVCRNCP